MRRSKHLRFSGVIAVSAVSLLAAWACGGSDSEKLRAAGLAQGCKLNSECQDPLVCTFTRCHTQCETDRDCTIGEQRCVRGPEGNVCQLSLETDCTKNANACKGAQVCGVDGECRDTCSASRACPSETQECAGGECVSILDTKDARDEDGNIVQDSFVDPLEAGGGGAVGSGGSSAGGRGGTSGGAGKGGTTGKGGSTGEAGGEAGGSSTSGGSAGAPPTGTGGANGTAGAPSTCEPGMGDCDNDPSDCETSLTLQTSCGACDVICSPENGVVTCNATKLECEVVSCATGFSDCNTDGTDGCEAELAVDSANCGQCRRSCGGGTCEASHCGAEIVMDPATDPATTHHYNGEAFLIGSQIVKINAENGTEIRTVTLPPSSPPSEGTPLATSTTATYGVYADSANVYYGLSGSPATVLYKPLDGSAAAKTAVNMPASTGYSVIIRGNTTALYLVGNSPYAIYTAPRPTASGAAATAGLVSGLTNRSQIHDLVVVGSRLFWVESTTPPAIYSAPLSGSPVTLIDDTIAYGYYVRLASDGTHAYWNTYQAASSKIRRVAAAGTPSLATVEEVAVGLNTPGLGLAVDATYVYFYAQYEVFRVRKNASTEPESLGNLSRPPYFYNLFAVDSGYVYGTGYTGEIVRLSKTPAN